MEVEVGKIIGGKYRLVRLLGRGGMGQVWVARHKTLEQDVAIKLMTHMDVDPELAEGAETALARFQLEAQVAASLSKRSRHIVAVTDHGYEEGSPYLVMDLLQGEGLDALLDRDRVLSVDRVVPIVTQTARGLAAAHGEGVVHRDLKPANIYLTRDEDGATCVKIVDFGIAGLERRAGAANSPKLTGLGVVLGSPHYMSPEQARGLTEIDRNVDLWALAVVAYEALTGIMPFDGKTPEDTIVRICMDTPKAITEVRSSLPSGLDAFFARAFARNVTDRFASAEEFASAFRTACGVDARGSAPSISDATPPVPLTAPRAAAPSVPDAPLSEPSTTTVAPTVDETSPPLPTNPGGKNTRAIAIGVVGLVALLAIIGLVWRVAHPPTEPSVASGDTSTTTAAPPASTVASETATSTATASASAPIAHVSPSATAPATVRTAATTTATATPTATATNTATATTTTTATSTIATAKPSASVDKGAIF